MHHLTTTQLYKLLTAMEDRATWPMFTDDPQVNYAVDCLMLEPGEEEEPYDESEYREEITASKDFN